MNAQDDVLILGGGHNGLVCACYLAAAGKRVRIVERRSIVGGAAVTEEFHPGFRNSTASYTVGLLDPQIVRDLKLHEHGLRLVPRPMANFLPLPNGESLSIHNDDAETAREFARFSPRDAEALPGFRAMIRDVGEIVLRQMHRPPPNVGGGLRDWVRAAQAGNDVTRLGKRRQRQLADLFLTPIADLLRGWFENPHIQAAFAFDAVVGNHASLHAPGTAYGLLHHALGEIAGRKGVWGHAIGGMGAITQAMLAQARELGVIVETGAEVTEVVLEAGRAQGAVLADGSVRRAKSIAANLAPKLLYLELIDNSVLDADFLGRIERTRTESAVLRMNVALSELPDFSCKPRAGIQDHHGAGIVIGPTLDYMENAYLDARRGDWSGHPVIELLIPSTVDDTLAPEGRHVASLFCQHFPHHRDWQQRREEAADTVFAAVDRFAPNFSRSVIARQILTPTDLEQRFRLPGGDIFHGAHTPAQLWSNRPVMGHAAYRGPIAGLYHCGAGAHPGGGVSGIPGRNAAREILRDLRKRGRIRWG
ncbi:MAG: NAD(P)/FAD-dependent oxidoreductase [Gammaproteobacteria bacterium]|nr:NAD(P)/FAD-dependent oxidoreductase [Gammaproteobacteria bacterium]